MNFDIFKKYKFQRLIYCLHGYMHCTWNASTLPQLQQYVLNNSVNGLILGHSMHVQFLWDLLVWGPMSIRQFKSPATCDYRSKQGSVSSSTNADCLVHSYPRHRIFKDRSQLPTSSQLTNKKPVEPSNKLTSSATGFLLRTSSGSHWVKLYH